MSQKLLLVILINKIADVGNGLIDLIADNGYNLFRGVICIIQIIIRVVMKRFIKH